MKPVQPFARVPCRLGRLIVTGMLVALVTTACGGGDPAAPPPPNNPAPPSGIGTAGGTVNGPSGSKVVVPAGALASSVDIAIAESSTGAPVLPGSVAELGKTFAFTPHGTAFAQPVTVTIPFDPTKLPAGATPALYKTNATQTAWEPVAGATVSGSSISGQITGFSYFVAVMQDFEDSYFFGDSTLEGSKLGSQVDSKGQPIDAIHGAAPIDLAPAGVEREAKAVVHVSSSGEVYWVSAVAPRVDYAVPDSKLGYQAVLIHLQKFRKTEPDAHMHLVISQMTAELMDGHGQLPSPTECPVLLSDGTSEDCESTLLSELQFSVWAWRAGSSPFDRTLARGDLSARLSGYLNHWSHTVGDLDPYSNLEFLTAPSFAFDGDVDQAVGDHARLALNTPIVVDIPLDTLADEESFFVQVSPFIDAENHRGADAFAGAWFRDPLETTGVSVEGTGFVAETIVSPLESLPPPIVQMPAASCPTGADPAAGTLQFANAAVRKGESVGGADAWIEVTRAGGAQGEVTVLFTTHDGSAHAGLDYTAVSTLVRFADGVQGTKIVPVPVLDNGDVNDNRTLTVDLTDLHGCAQLGSPSTATLTILDDDRKPVVVPTYSLGGTVSGLNGSGLELREMVSGATFAPAGNGAFAFAQKLPAGASYDVRVNTQPGNPLQSCGIANGTGAIGAADVVNIAVTCTTALPTGSLDPTFGGGRVTSDSASAASVALQPDGKSVVVGGRTLSRFNIDGSPDATFGTAGKVTLVANGGAVDGFVAIAVQADGKIVIAGNTSTPPSLVQDFALQRFNANGTLDAGFGSGGKVVTDFAGNGDVAYALALAPNGAIVVTGIAVVGTGPDADQDIAVARYLANGSLDASFGTGGKVTTNVAGKSDFGYGVALQGDGKIVVAGRVGVDGGSDPDFALVRYMPDGQLDLDFQTDGTLQIAYATSTWDEAEDLVIQSDGRIVVGGFARIGSTYQYAVMRFNATGSVDGSFGTEGRFNTGLSTRDNFGRALALQADGKIVIAGMLSSLSNGNFGVLRLTTDGAPDPSFGTAGLVTIDFFGGIDNALDLAIQADGNILVVGFAVNGSAGLAMARIVP